ncbi:hypothetical protein [Roseibium aestuarii]|uniref:Uncharacterized protein n=1 Tax=Roseibium aestuarii TaxID=2600299 RepID=A0ABW4K0U0_9HYPH|nr:hypothetical protein [Roseibium aestuarii]
MAFLASLPLTILPFLVYNVLALFGGPGLSFQSEMFSVPMVSGARFAMTFADLLVASALILLFFEILKATKIGKAALIDHILSVLVFVAYLVEFLIVPQAATSLFFILMVVSLVDVIAGFSISITGARRDVTFGPGEGHY